MRAVFVASFYARVRARYDSKTNFYPTPPTPTTPRLGVGGVGGAGCFFVTQISIILDKSQNFTTSLISTFRKGWLINRGNQPLLASPFQGAGLVTLNNCPAGAGAGNDAVERKN